MALDWFCGDCMQSFKAFVKVLLASLKNTPIQTGGLHGANSISSEQVMTGIFPCMFKCLDLKKWDYDRVCAEMHDPNVEHCIRQCVEEYGQCETALPQTHPPDSSDCQVDPSQILANLCQPIDASSLGMDHHEPHRRDLITPPTHEPTGKEHTHTRAPPKITSASPTHKITTLTELTNFPSVSTDVPSDTTANSPIPTSFTTLASSSTSTQSSSTPTLDVPQGTRGGNETVVHLSTGSKVGIAIGAALLCGVLYIMLRCCFKHAQKLNAARDVELERVASSLPLTFKNEIPEKHGHPVNEIDGRVTAHPPGPVRDGVFELGGEPVVASSSGVSEAPKMLATATEGNKPEEHTKTANADEIEVVASSPQR